MAGRSAGKRAGERRRAEARPRLFALAGGTTLAVVAWGYLVLAAIDFGAAGRSGDDGAWWFLGTAAVGAVACLFLALVLLARITRTLGITRAPEPTHGTDADDRSDPASGTATPKAPNGAKGGRRAAR